MPNYAVLVDTRDRLSPQITYVPQENLDVIINTQVSGILTATQKSYFLLHKFLSMK